MRFTILFAGVALAAGSTAAAAAPALEIGSAITVVNLVTAELEQDSRTLATGDKVHQDEDIIVGSDAKSELKLDDETKLALGPGSRMKLDKFVYDPDKTSGTIILDLVKGTFRFITGVASKPSYVIRTPAASITVRGTIFDLFIHDDGETWVLLHDGALQACNARGRCQDLNEPGKLIRISDDGSVDPPVKWAGLPDKDKTPFDDAFPFVVNAPSIDPEPILNREVIILGNLPEPTKHEDEPKYEEPDDQPSKKATKPRYKETKSPPRQQRTRTTKKSGGGDGLGTAIGIGIGIGIGLGGMKGGGHGGGGHKGGKY